MRPRSHRTKCAKAYAGREGDMFKGFLRTGEKPCVIGDENAKGSRV